jgi:putative aldouronate transport system substrate-binding protein
VIPNYEAHFTMLQDAGKLQPLNKLSEQYAPDLKMTKVMRDWYKTEDGNTYYYANYMYDSENPLDSNWTHTNIVARNDLMEQFSIKDEDFATKQGMLDALRKVKDATYNGNKVIPFSWPSSVDGGYAQAINLLSTMFGLRTEDKNGRLVDKWFTPEAIEAVKFLRLCFQEGLISPENITDTQDTFAQRANNGEFFAILAVYDQSAFRPTNNPLYAADSKAYYRFMPLTKGDGGKKPYVAGGGSAGWTGASITTACTQPERAIRFFSFMSQDAMQLNSVFGMEGAAWNWSDDSRKYIQYTQQYVEDTTANPSLIQLKYGAYLLDSWIQGWPGNITETPDLSRPEVIEKQKELTMYRENVGNGLPFFDIYPPNGTDLAGKYQKLKDKYNLETTKIIMSAKSDAEVDSMMAELKKYCEANDYDEVVAYADKRFQQNKAKLGLQYAYPESDL